MPTLPRAQDDIVHFAKAATIRAIDPEIQERMVMERAIIRRACRDLVAAGFGLRLWNEEYLDDERGVTQDVDALMADVHSCDDEWLHVFTRDELTPGGWRRTATVYFVYGNDGWDVMADYSVKLEEHLAGASNLSDLLSDDPHGQETRTQLYEAMGMSRSDAQGVVEAEAL